MSIPSVMSSGILPTHNFRVSDAMLAQKEIDEEATGDHLGNKIATVLVLPSHIIPEHKHIVPRQRNIISEQK